MALWLALLALWLWECLAFLGREGIAFASPSRANAKPRRGTGLYLAGAWPLRFTFSLDGLPFEVTPEQVIAAGPLTLFAATGASREERSQPWQDAAPEAHGAVVHTRAGALLRASSEVAAQRIAQALRQIARAEPAARPEAASAGLRAALSPERPAEQIARVRRATLAHRLIASLSLLGVSLGVPALAVTTQLAWSSIWENTWPAWIALHALGFLALAGAELRLRAPGRAGRLFRSAVYPPTQWRASHELASAALGALHPLAALSALLPAHALEPWARHSLSECDHPHFDVPAAAPEPHAEARRAALRARRAELEPFFAQAGLDLARLAEPPAQRDPTAGSYCPRCFEEFVATGWVCTDCQLETLPYPSAATQTPPVTP